MAEYSMSRVYPRGARGKIITVGGGKGGTGKTNVSVNLAISLAQRQKSVAIMDADIGCANVEVLLGLQSRETLQCVIEGRKSVSEILSVGPGDVRIVPGVSGLNHFVNLNRFEQLNVKMAIEELLRMFDYVIIDTMAGIGPLPVAFAVAADQVILVSTPEPSALLDAYAMLKMIRGLSPEAPVSVLINMFDEPHQALRAMNSLAAASSKHLGMTLRCAGIIPRDPNVPRAVLQSKPFSLLYPLTPASLAIKKVAAIFHGEPDAVVPEYKPGFFRRFAQSLGVAMY